MPSITYKPGGWYLRANLPKYNEKTGKMEMKDTWMRLGTHDKRTADRKLAEYEAKHPKSARLRNDILIRHLVELTRKRKKDDGLCYHRSDQYYLNRVEERFGSMTVGELGKDNLKEWQISLEREKLSTATISKYLRNLKAMVTWAMKEQHYKGMDPFMGFVIPKEGRPRDVIAEADDQRKIIQACAALREGRVILQTRSGAIGGALLADIVEVTLTHGLRVGEVIGVNRPTSRRTNGSGRMNFEKDKGIRVCDIEWKGTEGVLWLRRTKVKLRNNTGVTETMVPLHPNTAPILLRRCIGKRPEDLLFTHEDGRPIFTVYKPFLAFVKHFGLKGLDGRNRPVSRLQLRDLRKTAATNMLEAGAGTFQVATLMGHTNSRTTETVYLTRLKTGSMTEVSKRIAASLAERWKPTEPDKDLNPF